MNQPFSRIVKAGLLVGTLDILSAFIFYYSKTGKNPLAVLNYIASGIFGKEAFAGGGMMYVAGLLLHYLVAFLVTLFFFWLYPKIKPASKNKLLTGIFYGLFTWLVMNLLVVPMSKVAARPFNWQNAWINMVILIVCIGIPLSYLASLYDQGAKQKQV